MNEKIEERNEELHKLRKKTVSTVQVTTHMREKLQFLHYEVDTLRQELSQLESGHIHTPCPYTHRETYVHSQLCLSLYLSLSLSRYISPSLSLCVCRVVQSA